MLILRYSLLILNLNDESTNILGNVKGNNFVLTFSFHVQVICPTAPVIPITLNLGFRMPAWFDIESLDNLEEETDLDGVKASANLVYDILEGEIRSGIPSNRIIVGGFSQGTLQSCIYFLDTYIADITGLRNFFSIVYYIFFFPNRIVYLRLFVPTICRPFDLHACKTSFIFVVKL